MSLNEVQGPEDFDAEIRGPGERMITVGKYIELTWKGCAHCGCNITEDDAKWLTWWDDSPLCPKCAKEYQKE